MAKDRGMMFGTGEDRELDWDDEISYEHYDEHVVVNKNWIEGKEINAPTDWQPHREIIRYLEALFEQSENVGYVVQSYEKTVNSYLPTRAIMTARQVSLSNHCRSVTAI